MTSQVKYSNLTVVLILILFLLILQILLVYFRLFQSTEINLQNEHFFNELLRKNNENDPYNTNDYVTIESLPAISNDNSELILNSLIERSLYSNQLFITTIFISAAMLNPNEVRQYKVDKIDSTKIDQWRKLIKKQKSLLYMSNGRRSPIVKYTCRYSYGNRPLVSVEGHFLPNRQTSDSNSNRRFDIFRCPLSADTSLELYNQYAIKHVTANLTVEIYREFTKLIRYHIPWKSRRSGFLLTSPSYASKFNPWKNYNQQHSQLQHHSSSSSSSSSSHTSQPDFYICTSRNPDSQVNVDMVYRYLEFIQHHVLINTTHIFLAVPYNWTFPSMDHLIQTLSPFIKKQQLSIVSEAGDNINMWSSTLGLKWTRLAIKNLHINSCLYLAKGMAEYLGVWDVNEYFLPQLPHHTIQDVIQSVTFPFNFTLDPNDLLVNNIKHWRGGVGLADGDGHPLCYLALSGYSTKLKSVPRVSNHWIHGLYANGVLHEDESLVKSILPTNIIHQGGLHLSGGCKLDYEWTSCKIDDENNPKQRQQSSSEFCYTNIPDFMYIADQLETKSKVNSIPSQHNFDDVVQPRDTKRLNPQTDGYLVSFGGLIRNPLKEDVIIKSKNPYLQHYSQRVLEALQQNGIDYKLNDIPDEHVVNVKYPNGDGVTEWKPFVDVFPPSKDAQQDQAGSGLSPTDYPLEYDPNNIFGGSSNGYYNFQEDFTSDRIIETRNTPSKTLPAFAFDHSDIALGAVIERQHNSWNLFVTTFFLQHWMLWKPPKNYGFNGIFPSMKEKWEAISKRFNETAEYLQSGARDDSLHKYFCQFTINNQTHKVKGKFVPNALTTDRNANRRLDILRCQLRDSMRLYHTMITSNQQIEVEIFRNELKVFHYFIPWKTRRVGYSLSSPSMADSFDAWKGSDHQVTSPDSTATTATTATISSKQTIDTLHMCVAGIESSLSQHVTTHYLEFIQHHLNIGVQHMFLSTAYAWNGQNMADFLTVLKSYLDEKLVTVSSLANDNIDLLYTLLGASLDRDNAKVFHVNMCLYLSKGTAEYVAVWDTDEFFIPRPPHHTIIDVIQAAESPSPLTPHSTSSSSSSSWTGGRGWADHDKHPFCYLQLSSEVILSNTSSENVMSHWIAATHSSAPTSYPGLQFKKSIFPTDRIFQAGLHVGGACHLGQGWSGCNNSEFCYSENKYEVHGLVVENGRLTNLTSFHKFDSLVKDKDAKLIHAKTEAVIYHIQIHRPELTLESELESKSKSLPSSSSKVIPSDQPNDYVKYFFPAVQQELQRRGLDIIESLTDFEIPLPTEADYWPKLYEVTQKYVDNPGSVHDLERLPDPPDSFYGELNTLPHFTKDSTEIILGALIERKHSSWSLFATTFFLAHEQLANYTGKIINPTVRENSLKPWMKAIKYARKIKNTDYGVRNDGYEYYCLLQHQVGSRSYRVKAVFLPNELTPDVNANKRLDILRCQLLNSRHAYETLARTNESLFVEIFRGNESLVRYSIPWSIRRVGYMLTPPNNLLTTKLDPWKGYINQNQNKNQNKEEILPGDIDGDRIHMCVPGFESRISKTTLAYYSEFLQHHFGIGVEHIHIATTYTWNSHNMKLFYNAMKSYLEKNLISITTTANDIDLVYGLFGMSMHRDNVKIFYVNMCLYYAKGVTDYIAIWDIDEYFIPKLPHSTISDVISVMDISPSEKLKQIETKQLFEIENNWKGGKGWADKEAHPLCYFMMSSEVLFRSPKSSPMASTTSRWIGSRFTLQPEIQKNGLKFKKPIIPTRRIFQSALHMVGGCSLPFPFNGCYSNENDVKGNRDDEFCYSDSRTIAHRYGHTIQYAEDGSIKQRIEFSNEQRFDGLIMDKDSKLVNSLTEAVIYHIQIHRTYFVSQSELNTTNEYIQRYFDKVVKELKWSGLSFLTTIPKFYNQPEQPLDGNWISFNEMYVNISNHN